MTQLQTRETVQTPSEPVSPQEQGSKWTTFVVVGVVALLAAAFGVAIWANSDNQPETTTDFGASSDSVEIVQSEIDKAQASADSEPSSVEIVQNEIDKALAQTPPTADTPAVDPTADVGATGGLGATSFGMGSPELTPAQIEQARAEEYVEYLNRKWPNELTPAQIEQARAEEYVEYLERTYAAN